MIHRGPIWNRIPSCTLEAVFCSLEPMPVLPRGYRKNLEPQDQGSWILALDLLPRSHVNPPAVIWPQFSVLQTRGSTHSVRLVMEQV